MKPQHVRLFIKPGCPWCMEAIGALRARGVDYEVNDVVADPVAMMEMQRLTGQTLAPCIEVDGCILADFGADELNAWWAQMGFE